MGGVRTGTLRRCVGCGQPFAWAHASLPSWCLPPCLPACAPAVFALISPACIPPCLHVGPCPCLLLCSFLVTNTDYSFIGISSDKLGLVVAILMSALGGILLTSLLHGEILAMIGAGFQYWVMQPVFFNMLQVRARAAGGWEDCGRGMAAGIQEG